MGSSDRKRTTDFRGAPPRRLGAVVEPKDEGIVLPLPQRQNPLGNPGGSRGRIASIAVGSKLGERVVFGKYSGSEIEIKGEKHLIFKESELLAVLNDVKRDAAEVDTTRMAHADRDGNRDEVIGRILSLSREDFETLACFADDYRALKNKKKPEAQFIRRSVAEVLFDEADAPLERDIEF